MMPNLALCLCWLLAPPPAVRPEPQKTEAKKTESLEKIRAAIQHSCVRECFVLKDHDQHLDEKKRDERQQSCMRQCMDPEATRKALEAVVGEGWGLSKESAVEVCLPHGERIFLSELRCADGQAPTFKRSGNVGPRNPIESENFDESAMDPFFAVPARKKDDHIVDRYEVVCSDRTVAVFMDMYHCGTPKPWAAPKGFARPVEQR